jgi:hypothetical protein
MSKKGGSTTQTQTNRYAAPVSRIQKQGESIFNGIANNPYQSYDPTQRVAGVDQNLMGDLSGFYGQARNSGVQGFNMMQGAGAEGLNFSRFTNPFQTQVKDAANANFDFAQDQSFNALNQRAAAQGAFNNSRYGSAAGKAAGDIARERANTMSQIDYSGYMDSMDRARQYGQDQFSQGQNLANLGFTGAQGQLGIEDYSRGAEQEGLNARYEEFMRRQNDPYQRLNAKNTALGGPWDTTQTSKTEQENSMLGNIMGMAGAIGGLAGGPIGAKVGSLAGSIFGGGGMAPPQLMQTSMVQNPNAGVQMRGGMLDANNYFGGWNPGGQG